MSFDTTFMPLELMTDYNGTWPFIDTLSASGKQVLFVTGYDFGKVIDPIIFSKYALAQLLGNHTIHASNRIVATCVIPAVCAAPFLVQS